MPVAGGHDIGGIGDLIVEVGVAVAQRQFPGAAAAVPSRAEGMGDLGRGEGAGGGIVGAAFAGQDPGALDIPGAEIVVAGL